MSIFIINDYNKESGYVERMANENCTGSGEAK